METSNSLIEWDADDFGPKWYGVVVSDNPDDFTDFKKYMIDVDDESVKFKVWVGTKKEPWQHTEVKTGPLSKLFDCLCQAKAACEAHHARK